ncbi:hypothetical protein PARA125_001686 [Parachlamydia sp. AcF125]|nr:hypothetical protein [Parachlamydia sp. AcF125]
MQCFWKKLGDREISRSGDQLPLSFKTKAAATPSRYLGTSNDKTLFVTAKTSANATAHQNPST